MPLIVSPGGLTGKELRKTAAYFSYRLMDELIIFTDGSVNTRSKIGYGACLSISERGLPLDSLRSRVKVKRFENTSSTKLELQALLWALGDVQALGQKVIIYTDSQNIMGLRERRDRLEKNDYFSKKNRHLNNYELYQAFFRMTDRLDCEFIRVPGHKVSHQKNDIDTIFALVDRASRNALRGEKNGCA
jgi:ribonuclease HI